MKIENWTFYKYKINPNKYRNWPVILLHSIFHLFSHRLFTFAFCNSPLLKLRPYVFHLLVRFSSYFLFLCLCFWDLCFRILLIELFVMISVHCNLCLFWVLCWLRKWKIFNLRLRLLILDFDIVKEFGQLTLIFG